jgi:hypothetical protein
VEKIGLVGISRKIAGREPNEGGSRVDARRSIVNGSDQLWRWSCSMYRMSSSTGLALRVARHGLVVGSKEEKAY